MTSESDRTLMTWSFYPARQNFVHFAAEWDNLNRRLYRGHPFFDSCYVGPLVDHFATAREILAVHRVGDLADGMLLFTKQRTIWGTFLPSQTQITPAFLSGNRLLHELLRSLPPAVVEVDLLCQDPDYSIAGALGSDVPHEVTPHVTTLNIEIAGTFQEYWQARPKSLRQEMRRKSRELERDGLVPRLEVLRDPRTVREGLVRYGLMESRGWKGREGTAIHPSNAQGRFYEDMLLRFAARDRARIFELYLNDKLAASQFGVANDYMLVALKTTYDDSLAKYSPGTVLDQLMLEHEFSQHCHQVVEYYTNASREVLRWGTAYRVISHHSMYRYPWLVPLVQRFRRLRTRFQRSTSTAATKSGGLA